MEKIVCGPVVEIIDTGRKRDLNTRCLIKEDDGTLRVMLSTDKNGIMTRYMSSDEVEKINAKILQNVSNTMSDYYSNNGA